MIYKENGLPDQMNVSMKQIPPQTFHYKNTEKLSIIVYGCTSSEQHMYK